MWRKPNEAKPASQPVNSPAAAAVQTKAAVPVAPPIESQPSAVHPPVSHAAAPQAAPAPPPMIPAPAAKPAVVRESSNASRIGSGLKIRGELSGNADLFVDGELQGKITLADSRVTVGNSGRVQADIEARDIVIEGSVQGNLKAHESVHLGSTSRVQGSVLTPRIGIDDGARLRGKVEMVRVSETDGPSASDSTEVLRPVHARGKDA
jgi:cytoskeletal protein CcmA (bactofilin family)